MNSIPSEPNEKHTGLSTVSGLPKLRVSPSFRSWGHCAETFLSVEASAPQQMATISGTHPPAAEINDGCSFPIQSGFYAYSHLGRKKELLPSHQISWGYLHYSLPHPQPNIHGPDEVECPSLDTAQ